MPKETKPNRRQLLGGAAATTAALAMPATVNSKTKIDGKPLKGKSMLITGCSSGFGYLGAQHYARLGATVFATMRNTPRPEAEALQAIAKKEKLDIRVMRLDVTQQYEVDDAAAHVAKEVGALDILINNAGIGMAGPIEVQDIEATKLMFETNVFGVQRVTKAFLPAMRARKQGWIVNISSQLGRLIAPAFGQYSPSKFALEAMSEQMAYELVPHGIEVTIIQPGGYPTDIWKKRNQYDKQLLARSDKALLEAYGPFTARMGKADGGGRNTDPMDIPHAIAEIALMPAGKRPLRRAVHPVRRPQEAINDVSAKVQLAMLGAGGAASLVKAVHD